MIKLSGVFNFTGAATKTQTATVPGSPDTSFAYFRVKSRATSVGNVTAATMVTKPSKAKALTVPSFLTADFGGAVAGNLLARNAQALPLAAGVESDAYRIQVPAGEQIVVSITTDGAADVEWEVRMF